MPERISQNDIPQTDKEKQADIINSLTGKTNVADKLKSIDLTQITKASLARSLSDWRGILSKECQVYVIGEQYLAKRFDQVHFKYCEVKEAEEIVTDNLYAILLYKYFPIQDDDSYKRIDDIVRAMTKNIKTFLTKVAFEDYITDDKRGIKIKQLPNSAIAFSNGVYDFKENKWLCLFEEIYVPKLNNSIVLYNEYIIFWNFNFKFEPLDIDINEISFKDFISIMKELDKTNPNYCFELFYNMSHDSIHKVSFKRMEHLAEIFGYTLIAQFLQYFVMLIGTGQNGKNSLLDGCLSAFITPRPAGNSLDDIENDKFIMESLSNVSHNIFLETTAKTYTNSNRLKALTGSMFQTVEAKGKGKYSGFINCKFIFAGNDQDAIKFSDATVGFRRRINIFEIYYRWDPAHKFMRRGDYYATDFSNDLKEIKSDIMNAVMYIYIGMYGIKLATNDFKRDFKFSHNEWNDSYSDADVDIKDFLEIRMDAKDYFVALNNDLELDKELLKYSIYDENKIPLWKSPYLAEYDVQTFEELQDWCLHTTTELTTDEYGDPVETEIPNYYRIINATDFYVSLRFLKAIIFRRKMETMEQPDFNNMIRKLFPYAQLVRLMHKDLCIKMTKNGNRLKIAE